MLYGKATIGEFCFVWCLFAYTEPPDLNLLCNHLHVAISGTPTSPQSSIATLTSLPLDYSSSGPSLEYYAYKADTQVKRTESEVENPTKELVHEPMNEVEAGITTIERSPDKEQAAVCEMESTDGSSTLSSQTPHPQVLSDELAFPHTFIHEHSAHNDTGATSETTSLHVQVGDTLLHSASSKSSTESESDDASSHAGSLTDVSTCSSDGSPLTDHRPSINIEQKPDALEDRETTDALPVLMLPASMLPTLERKDNPGRCALEQESPSTIPQTIDQPTPGNGENMTGATRGATSQAHSEGGEQVAENDSHVPTSKTSHPATELKATTEQPPQPPIHASRYTHRHIEPLDLDHLAQQVDWLLYIEHYYLCFSHPICTHAVFADQKLAYPISSCLSKSWSAP